MVYGPRSFAASPVKDYVTLPGWFHRLDRVAIRKAPECSVNLHSMVWQAKSECETVWKAFENTVM